jgi:hypothetical protein
MDWIPLKHQLDALRMDVQYVLRHVTEVTARGKAFQPKKSDRLPALLAEHGVLRKIENTNLFRVTLFGRKLVDNDHALREIAMEWMDLLPEEQILTLQHDIIHWQFRDPVIRKFMEEIAGADGGPTMDDFFPQAPWYYHTVGYRNVPKGLRNITAEEEYTKGGYTGNETSAWEIAHGSEEVAV